MKKSIPKKKEWPTKRKNGDRIRVDSVYKEFIRREIPDKTDIERSRFIMEWMLYGKKKNKP